MAQLSSVGLGEVLEDSNNIDSLNAAMKLGLMVILPNDTVVRTMTVLEKAVEATIIFHQYPLLLYRGTILRDGRIVHIEFFHEDILEVVSLPEDFKWEELPRWGDPGLEIQWPKSWEKLGDLCK